MGAVEDGHRLGEKREGAGEDAQDPIPVSPMDFQMPPGREKMRQTSGFELGYI